MPKPYINNAVVGNSSMLACIDEKGQLIRLFWPGIDRFQQVSSFLIGISQANGHGGTKWLNGDGFGHSQHYLPDTNVLETVCTEVEGHLQIQQADFVLPDRDVLVRLIDIRNTGPAEADLDLVLYSSFSSAIHDPAGSMFDFDTDALVHYRHGCYMAVYANVFSMGFQLGSSACYAAGKNEFHGYDAIGMTPEAAVSWRLGRIQAGEKKRFLLGLCFSDSLAGLRERVRELRALDGDELLQKTVDYWRRFLASARQVTTGDVRLDSLYKRSLLLLRLMWDKRHGGIIAAPEVDEEFSRCGRYAYCWGRDAAFITEALDRSGLTHMVDSFYGWAVKAQDESGLWHQRYYADGNLAPSWGLQPDEIGTLVWGMMRHYQANKDRGFLAGVWESARKAVEFLLGYTDPETGLPLPGYDLWEESFGEHTYSTAAVCAGIRAGAEMARQLVKAEGLAEYWEKRYEEMRTAMEKKLWSEKQGRFLRSVRVKLNPWGEETAGEDVRITVKRRSFVRRLFPEDARIDASLIGVSVPFELFPPDDPRVISTVEAIERSLTYPGGGIGRYEGDSYIGGNPWLVTTLWLALYHIRAKNFARARMCLDWAVRGRTGLDLLPEQVDKNTGKPVWVIPLTWSHAMYILVLLELLEAGEL